jgi:hypothetical protein
MGSSENRARFLTSRKAVALGILLYAGLSVAILMDEAVPDYLVEWVPRWAGLIALTVIGPAMLLALGIGAWKLFVGSLLAVAACLVLTWMAWRQWPDSELFVVGLLAAGALWAGSGWLTVALGW